MSDSNGLQVDERVSSGGIAYTVVRDGTGEGKPWVLFCTGLTLNRFCWSDWHAPMAHRYNLALFDVPGYGDSPIDRADLESRQVADWADYYVAVMDELGADRAYVVAEQTGGAAALYLALAHPERVIALALISTPFQGRAIGSTISGYKVEAGRGGMVAWSDHMMPRLFEGDDDSPLRTSIREIHLANDLDVILHDGGTWSAVDLEADLPKLQAPTLLVAPGRSPIIAREHSFEMERLIPDSTLVLFGGSSQLVAFTEADTVSRMTTRFFERHGVNGR